MNAHFSSFTPEAMRAFGQELADGFPRRTEFVNDIRNHTFAMLAGFRKERRERAPGEAEARRLFVSELKSGVHSLMGRFELSRKEMTRELQAACDAFRNRPGRRRRQQLKQTQSSPSGQPFEADGESQNSPEARSWGTDKRGHSKKRNG